MMLLLGYIVLGFVAIFGTATGHIYRAENRGYKAIEWWDAYGKLPGECYMIPGKPKLSFVLGTLIWPVKLANMLTILSECYNEYELKD